ncbi:unnamed protein product [Auanema sp. JU1783]|nr:unnamed protein product [Auanema sp. JU1783]
MIEDSVIAELVNKYRCHNKLPKDFSSTPESSSISVRELSLGLKNLIGQQQKRYPAKIDKIFNSLIYKRKSQQRRQSYWRDVIAVHTTFRKYQSNNLLELLNTVSTKIEKFNTYFYQLTPEMSMHIAASFVAQLFLLERMSKLMVSLVNKLFGYIQINHWEKLGVFVIGVCADIFYMIPDQTKKICEAYSSVAKHFIAVDPSFPKSLEDLRLVSKLLNAGSINSLPDTKKILSMLSLSDDDLKTANIEENIRRIREEVLENQACEVMDIGTAISREEVEESTEKSLKRKLSSVDSAIGTDMNTTAGSIPDDVFHSTSKNRKKFHKKGCLPLALSTMDSTEPNKGFGLGTIVLVSIVTFIIYYFVKKSFKPVKVKTPKLSEEEIDEILSKWSPEPLVPETQPDHHALNVKLIDGKITKNVEIEGKKYLNFSTSNFLSLVGEPRIEEVAKKTIYKYGVGSCGPRGFYGTVDVHLDLESDLAKFMGTEEAVLYSYGFATIASAISAYAKSGDIIYVDRNANFAIQKGIQASRSKIEYFNHNDMEDLERLLIKQAEWDAQHPKQASKIRRFLVVEGLYANSGDLCPLPKIIELKWKYKVRVFIDESWSFGVVGKTGRG